MTYLLQRLASAVLTVSALAATISGVLTAVAPSGGVAGPRSSLMRRGPVATRRSADSDWSTRARSGSWQLRTIHRLRPGNLQGLTIGRLDGPAHLWTTTAGSNGSARIGEYLLDGKPLISSPPLPLGHAAGLAVDPDGTLAVVNGGPNALTRISIVDPLTWIVLRRIDLRALGPNGLIAARPRGG